MHDAVKNLVGIMFLFYKIEKKIKEKHLEKRIFYFFLNYKL